jgi:hypothetical protein
VTTLTIRQSKTRIVSDTDDEVETARDLLAGFGAFEGTERRETTVAVHRQTRQKSGRRTNCSSNGTASE